jgi:hypothetical protein
VIYHLFPPVLGRLWAYTGAGDPVTFVTLSIDTTKADYLSDVALDFGVYGRICG